MQEEKRFRVKAKDQSGIDFGVVQAEFIVVAESAPEAEMYVRQFVWDDESAVFDSVFDSFDITTTDIPTGE